MLAAIAKRLLANWQGRVALTSANNSGVWILGRIQTEEGNLTAAVQRFFPPKLESDPHGMKAP